MQPLDWALLPFSRYFDFSGRSSRAEYWYFTVLIWFVSLLILLGQLALGQAVESVLTVVNALFGLITFIPQWPSPCADCMTSIAADSSCSNISSASRYPGSNAVCLILRGVSSAFVWRGGVVVTLKFLVLMILEAIVDPIFMVPTHMPDLRV